MSYSNSTSCKASDPSVEIQYAMEDESQENRNYESTDFVCPDQGGEKLGGETSGPLLLNV